MIPDLKTPSLKEYERPKGSTQLPFAEYGMKKKTKPKNRMEVFVVNNYNIKLFTVLVLGLFFRNIHLSL